MVGRIIIALVRKQGGKQQESPIFFSYFVITTPHPPNLIKNILIGYVLQEKCKIRNNSGKKLKFEGRDKKLNQMDRK